MRDLMCELPDVRLFRYAVYACGHKIGLSDKPKQPVALFKLHSHAVEMGSRMWPATYEIVDLEEHRP